MRLQKKSLLLILTLLFAACDSFIGQNCGACFTPPAFFHINLIDKNTSVSIFSQQEYDLNNVVVVNADTDEKIGFYVVSENGYQLIVIDSIGWQTESVRAKIIINNTTLMNLDIEADRISDNCCTYTNFDKIEFDKENTLDPSNGIYTVTLNL